MDCFWCSIRSGSLTLREAEAARWLTAEKLDSVEWLPADRSLIEKIRQGLKG
jgi:8-oxo-dGTP diphosphatase